jgi:cellulose synthase/poly-beta-1,6-N-acetylglucosamine synthase-like glycosyltransferase
METALLELRGLGAGRVADAYLLLLFVTLLTFAEFPLLLAAVFLRRALGGWMRVPRPAAPMGQAAALPVLVVIPSLLRKRDELTSMQSTVTSILENSYSGSLTIVLSIDGTGEVPALYAELRDWASRVACDSRFTLHVTGTPGRRGKPMAIDHAVEHARQLVTRGVLPGFPPVYVSTDADADLGPGALEAIVARLQRRHLLTGAPPRVVAGALRVRGDGFWRGWKAFFSVEGQLNLQVAREYLVSNVGRYNLRLMPVTGVPGAFYATWSEIFLALPRYLAFDRTLRPRHWLGWWLGRPPPRFSDSRVEPLPERVAGDTDDTVTAYVASLVRWEGGRFTFDPPRTPLHAAWYLLRSLLVDRPIQYEPRARVYTSSPATARALFRQRRRWNTARLELTMRLVRSLGFHWSIGLPGLVVVGMMARSFLLGLVAYLILPVLVVPSHLGPMVVIAWLGQVLVAGLLTLSALIIEAELGSWRVLLALPLLPAYTVAFRWVPAATGFLQDVFLFGNATGFSPEWTLKRGGSVRIALLFRFRRAALLALRALWHGDVPLGAFWLGWGDTPWTPSGFEGWTTGKRPASILTRRAPAVVRDI